MRIVSWNIQWGRGADGCVDLTRTLEVLRRVGADVLCLQEVAVNLPGLPGGVTEDGCQILCEGMPDYTPVFAPAVDVAVAGGGRGQFGNLILSRLPIDQVWRHLLPWPADARVSSMQRGCVEVVIRQAMNRCGCSQPIWSTTLQVLAWLRPSDLPSCSKRRARWRRRHRWTKSATRRLRHARDRRARCCVATSIAAPAMPLTKRCLRAFRQRRGVMLGLLCMARCRMRTRSGSTARSGRWNRSVATTFWSVQTFSQHCAVSRCVPIPRRPIISLWCWTCSELPVRRALGRHATCRARSSASGK